MVENVFYGSGDDDSGSDGSGGVGDAGAIIFELLLNGI